MTQWCAAACAFLPEQGLCLPSDALQTLFKSASEARQKFRDPDELAVETARAGFRGAPEEAEMAEAPCCEHLSANPIHIQLWQREIW